MRDSISQRVKAILQNSPEFGLTEVRQELNNQGVQTLDTTIVSAINYWKGGKKTRTNKLDNNVALLEMVGKLHVLSEDIPLAMIASIADICYRQGKENMDSILDFLSKVKGEALV